MSMSFSAADFAVLAPSVPGLLGDIRSDHAGETGAVMIYRGILAGARDPAIRAFATTHLATEQDHLDLLETMLPPSQRSLLLPIWRIAGFITGFLPTLSGARAVYATIDAVETFVDHHYQEQIDKLASHGAAGALRSLLLVCQADEVHHRDEAREAQDRPAGRALRAWAWLVGFGSRNAVMAARKI
jgi:ubiquinone biosynthesis monooxygenase Coq7